MFDALDNEPRTLDTIIAEGFKRIDEAIEGVIFKHTALVDITIEATRSREVLKAI
jgi:hypothetical protein